MVNTFLHQGTTVTDEQENVVFSWDDSFQKYSYIALLGLTGLYVYSYLNMFEITASAWSLPAYSHGWIIPLISLFLMWSLRPNPAAQEPPRGQAQETFFGFMPCGQLKPLIGIGTVLLIAGMGSSMPMVQYAGLILACFAGLAYIMVGQPFYKANAIEQWLGVVMIISALASRAFFSSVYNVQPLNRLSFVVGIFGVFLLVGGWRILRWTGASLGFLVFMFPIPSMLERLVLGRLQKLATIMSEMVLTILGMPVNREGNRIIVEGIPLEVAEACSGLRMVTIFLAMALATVILSKRPWWDQFIILVSAIPIALIVNIVRIVMTAVLYTSTDSETVHNLIHDWAGFAMMPLAMGLLYLEHKVLSMLSVPEDSLIDSPNMTGTFMPR